jgi:hypothetical protein
MTSTQLARILGVRVLDLSSLRRKLDKDASVLALVLREDRGAGSKIARTVCMNELKVLLMLLETCTGEAEDAEDGADPPAAGSSRDSSVVIVSRSDSDWITSAGWNAVASPRLVTTPLLPSVAPPPASRSRCSAVCSRESSSNLCLSSACCGDSAGALSEVASGAGAALPGVTPPAPPLSEAEALISFTGVGDNSSDSLTRECTYLRRLEITSVTTPALALSSSYWRASTMVFRISVDCAALLAAWSVDGQCAECRLDTWGWLMSVVPDRNDEEKSAAIGWELWAAPMLGCW